MRQIKAKLLTINIFFRKTDLTCHVYHIHIVSLDPLSNIGFDNQFFDKWIRIHP